MVNVFFQMSKNVIKKIPLLIIIRDQILISLSIHPIWYFQRIFSISPFSFGQFRTEISLIESQWVESVQRFRNNILGGKRRLKYFFIFKIFSGAYCLLSSRVWVSFIKMYLDVENAHWPWTNIFDQGSWSKILSL